jgi:hypothetical protein
MTGGYDWAEQRFYLYPSCMQNATQRPRSTAPSLQEIDAIYPSPCVVAETVSMPENTLENPFEGIFCKTKGMKTDGIQIVRNDEIMH